MASDEQCDRAACALCVGVGRLHEPKECGMARSLDYIYDILITILIQSIYIMITLYYIINI